MIDILSQHSKTLPSGFKITFTVGRIVKDKPHSLPRRQTAADAPEVKLLPTSGAQSQSGAA